MNPKVAAIIQARQGSVRLPGKVMKKVLGKPLLEFLLERVARVPALQDVVVATTDQESDDPIASFCERASISYYRGDSEDVLGRFLGAAQKFSVEVIVRITADCPLIAPEIIDKVVQRYLSLYPEIDYVSNTLIRTYPRGMDVEVFSFKSLNEAAERAVKVSDREHVTSFIYSHPHRFRLAKVLGDIDDSRFRWTVDTQEDFQLIKNLIETLYPANNQFTYKDLLEAMEEHPDWFFINSHVEQKKDS